MYVMVHMLSRIVKYCLICHSVGSYIQNVKPGCYETTLASTSSDISASDTLCRDCLIIGGGRLHILRRPEISSRRDINTNILCSQVKAAARTQVVGYSSLSRSAHSASESFLEATFAFAEVGEPQAIVRHQEKNENRAQSQKGRDLQEKWQRSEQKKTKAKNKRTKLFANLPR